MAIESAGAPARSPRRRARFGGVCGGIGHREHGLCGTPASSDNADDVDRTAAACAQPVRPLGLAPDMLRH
jgi:hypothetical protein